MKKIFLLLCLSLGLAANALELTEAHEKAIENTVKHYQNILKQDFNANISCPQIFGLINAMLMMQAKAANAPKNVPVPTINSVRRTHNAKKSTDKYSVNWGRLPKEMADKLSEGIVLTCKGFRKGGALYMDLPQGLYVAGKEHGITSLEIL